MITYLHFSCRPFLSYEDNKKISIKIAALGSAKEQPIKIELWGYPNNEPTIVTMKNCIQTETFTIYGAEILTDPSYNLQSYVFRIYMPNNEIKWLSSLKLGTNEPLASERYTVNLHISSADWIHDQSFYQIFPDRFASSTIEDKDFSDQIPPTPDNLENIRYKGDLKAILNKIDYIKKLGFTGIYLNPVNDSKSVHGFDSTDFFNVNPALGTNQDLIDLITEIHNQGMKIILDLPITNVSDHHPMYDILDKTGVGACHHKESDYHNCFSFVNGKVITCNKDTHQIKLNYASKKVQDMIYRNDDSVIKHYLKEPYSVDGIRIVYSHMLGSKGSAYDNHRYLKKIMTEAKSVNPSCYIMGDHYYDARPWICLNFAQEDGALNFQGFYKPMIQFLSGKDYYTSERIKYKGEDFKACIDRYHCGIPQDMLNNMFNIIGNHDTKRIASSLNNNPQMIRLALTMMYTWIGIPCVYYGDEIGLTGGVYNEARKPMEWNNNQDIFKNILMVLSKFRENSDCLRLGALRVTYGDNNVITYERSYDWNKIIIIINRGNSIATVDVNDNLRDLLIQTRVMCNDQEKSACQIVPKDNKNSIIMDNIRIMTYSELDKSGIIKVGPTSALIIA